MKKVFCIAYDLIGDDRDGDHGAIEEKLVLLHGKRIQESVWIIISDDVDSLTCDLLEHKLSRYFDKDDRLFITKVSKDHVLIHPYDKSILNH